MQEQLLKLNCISGEVRTDGDLFKTMDIYDTQSDEWFSGLEVVEQEKVIVPFLIKEKFSFWGGEDSTEFLNTVDIYEIISSSWITGYFGEAGQIM